MYFSIGKTRMIRLPYQAICWRKYNDMLSRLDTISERDRQTDGQNYYININGIAVLTRDKKHIKSLKCVKMSVMERE